MEEKEILKVMDAFNVEHVYVSDTEVFLTEKEGTRRVTREELNQVQKPNKK